jgi:hypothetical protein
MAAKPTPGRKAWGVTETLTLPLVHITGDTTQPLHFSIGLLRLRGNVADAGFCHQTRAGSLDVVDGMFLGQVSTRHLLGRFVSLDVRQGFFRAHLRERVNSR